MRIGRAAGVTDTGRRRLRNEDAFVCEPPLFAVTDGMGGARAGEIAAELAANALEEGAREVSGTDALVELLEEANRRIWERSVADPQTTGMGAVATVALVERGDVAIGHVGDSRAYLLRDGELTQVTTDHTFVEYLVETGRLTREQARRHPQRSVLLRVLGDAEGDVQLDESIREAVPGDRWLLCSDGLSGPVTGETIAEVLSSVEDPGQAADQLIDLALRAVPS